jgi:oxygen-dependent protoporphyrinogen oxidase
MGIAHRGILLAGGRPEAYPLRMALSIGERLSFIRMGLRLRKGTKRLLLAMAARQGETSSDRRQRLLAFENDRTLSDYIGALNPEIDLLLRTITERTSATPERMAAGYGLRSFANVWSTYSPGHNLVGGSGLLPSTLSERLGASLRTGAQVTRVEQTASHVVCTYTREGALHSVESRHAIVAIPALRHFRDRCGPARGHRKQPPPNLLRTVFECGRSD